MKTLTARFRKNKMVVKIFSVLLFFLAPGLIN